MATLTGPEQAARMPAIPRALGFAGLLPQAAPVALLAIGPPVWRFAALSIAYAYPALILSFLGGTWWGLAAGRADKAPGWTWAAAVAPSLVALLTAVPWAIGETWPGPSLVVRGLALMAALLVDRRLVRAGIAPAWWMSLRVPLSIGLGLLTLLAAALG